MSGLLNSFRFGTGGGGGGGWAATVAALAPDAWYRLNEASGTTMTDSSGNGRHGTYGAAVTFNIAGATTDGDKAITTSGGSTGCGDVSYASWMLYSTALTMAAWVKWSTSPGTSMFWSRTGSGGGWPGGLWVSGGGIRWNIGPNQLDSAASTYNNGAWHFVVGTWLPTTGNQKLYIDGTLSVSSTNNTPTDTGGQGLEVGGRGGNYFAGSVDECLYWHGMALSSTDVAALYAAA